jgi:hypothetical protein
VIPAAFRYRPTIPSGGSIQVVSTSSAVADVAVANSGNAFATLPAPSGIVAGNLLFAYAVYDDLNAVSSLAPAGWTVQRAYNYSTHNNTGFIATLWKIATANEPASYSFGSASINTISVGCVQLSGVSQSNPFGGIGPTNTKINSATTTFATLTRAVAGLELLVAGTGSNYSSTVANAWTPPSGYTQLPAVTGNYNKNNTSESQAIFAAYNLNAPVGATGALTGTLNKAYYNGTFNISFNPA